MTDCWTQIGILRSGDVGGGAPQSPFCSSLCFLLFFWHKSVWMSSEAHQTIPDFYFYFHLCCCPSSSFWNVTVLQVWGPTEWLQGRLNTYTCRLPKNHQIVPALEIGLLLLPSISFSVESKEDRQPQKKPERAFSATSVGDLKRTIFK